MMIGYTADQNYVALKRKIGFEINYQSLLLPAFLNKLIPIK